MEWVRSRGCQARIDGQLNPLKEASRISRFRGDLCLRHDVVIACVYVSAADARSAGSPLLHNIRAEGVSL